MSAPGGTATASAPGRVCLGGESLDWMTGGSSVVAAVPLRTKVTAWWTPGGDALSLVSGSPVHRTRLVPAQRVFDHGYDGDVLDHLQAAAQVTLHTAEDIAGTMLTATTDLPVSAGLSSSAALTLAAVAALSGLAGDELGPLAACQLARQAEVGELHSGAGWMDFLACAYGGVSRVDATAVTVRRLAPTLGIPVLVIDTVDRRTTKAVLASKRDRFQAREPGMLAYSREAPVLVDSLTEALTSHPADHREVGRLINAYHALLRDLVHCSTPLIEACVEQVLTAGAVGAKLSGSGHGGCLLVLVPDDAVASVLASLAELPVRVLALPEGEPVGLTIRPVPRQSLN